jgi:hypothetical protein
VAKENRKIKRALVDENIALLSRNNDKELVSEIGTHYIKRC